LDGVRESGMGDGKPSVSCDPRSSSLARLGTAAVGRIVSPIGHCVSSQPYPPAAPVPRRSSIRDRSHEQKPFLYRVRVPLALTIEDSEHQLAACCTASYTASQRGTFQRRGGLGRWVLAVLTASASQTFGVSATTWGRLNPRHMSQSASAEWPHVHLYTEWSASTRRLSNVAVAVQSTKRPDESPSN